MSEGSLTSLAPPWLCPPLSEAQPLTWALLLQSTSALPWPLRAPPPSTTPLRPVALGQDLLHWALLTGAAPDLGEGRGATKAKGTPCDSRLPQTLRGK